MESQCFCCTVLPLQHYHKLRVVVVPVTVLVSYFELWSFFWREAEGKKMMKYSVVPFPQCQTDVNHKQPTKECVNTDPR